MNDLPRIQEPYSNMVSPVSYDRTSEKTDGNVPKGKKVSKLSRGELALQGLIGVK